MTFTFFESEKRVAAIKERFPSAVVSEPSADGYARITIELNTGHDALVLFHAGIEHGAKEISNAVVSEFAL